MRKTAFALLFAAAALGFTVGSAHAADGTTEPKEPTKHTVAGGESLSTIATDSKLETWRPIWNANTNLQNPDQITPGQELVIPNAPTSDRPLPPGYGEPTPVPVAAAAPVAAAQTSYKPAARSTARVSGNPSGIFQRICQRESGCNYATNTGNGYYGAYQYDVGTWNNYGGYARADLAPPAVQDAKAAETYAARGCSPWPNTCY